MILWNATNSEDERDSRDLMLDFFAFLARKLLKQRDNSKLRCQKSSSRETSRIREETGYIGLSKKKNTRKEGTGGGEGCGIRVRKRNITMRKETKSILKGQQSPQTPSGVIIIAKEVSRTRCGRCHGVARQLWWLGRAPVHG